MSLVVEEQLTPHVRDIAILAEKKGLNFYNTEFILVSADEMSAIAAQGGFPRRYPHYTFGQEFEVARQHYRWGRSRIYEMVINTDPAYAYLLEGNLPIDQKLVMAHVFGHVDFFKNNIWFKPTRGDAVEMMANHGVRIERIIDQVGAETVERWIDRCLSVQWLIDAYAQYHAGFPDKLDIPDNSDELPQLQLQGFDPHRYRHDDPDVQAAMNPDDYINAQRVKYIRAISKQISFPPEPEADILAFLICHGRMKRWEREILAMIREESYYFAPQAMTKIMNEGWAVYWHTTLMDEYADPSEWLLYADHHAGVVHWPQGHLNPYALGWKLFKHIEDRWDKGKFGQEWEDCTDRITRDTWDRKLGLGRAKLFEIRGEYNDIGFLSEFIDEDFVEKYLMFIYSQDTDTSEIVLESNDWRDIRNALVHSLTFRGQPRLIVSDGNYRNRGELLIDQKIEDDDTEVAQDTAHDVLESLALMWGRPVTLRTSTWTESVDPAELEEFSPNYLQRSLGLA